MHGLLVYVSRQLSSIVGTISFGDEGALGRAWKLALPRPYTGSMRLSDSEYVYAPGK